MFVSLIKFKFDNAYFKLLIIRFQPKKDAMANSSCSHKDIKWIKEVFWKKDKFQFDLEREYGFRLMIHDRDWIAGRTIRANVMDGMEKSRRVIFVLSRYTM